SPSPAGILLRGVRYARNNLIPKADLTATSSRYLESARVSWDHDGSRCTARDVPGWGYTLPSADQRPPFRSFCFLPYTTSRPIHAHRVSRASDVDRVQAADQRRYPPYTRRRNLPQVAPHLLGASDGKRCLWFPLYWDTYRV